MLLCKLNMEGWNCNNAKLFIATTDHLAQLKFVLPTTRIHEMTCGRFNCIKAQSYDRFVPLFRMTVKQHL